MRAAGAHGQEQGQGPGPGSRGGGEDLDERAGGESSFGEAVIEAGEAEGDRRSARPASGFNFPDALGEVRK